MPVLFLSRDSPHLVLQRECPRMTPINANKALSELNSFASILACQPWRVIRGQTWLAGILILLLFPSAFAQTDFSAFWKKFRSAVIAGDKAVAAEMTKFPLSMPYGVKTVKNKEDFLRRYNEIFKGEANAAKCFASAKPEKESARRCGSTALLRRLRTTGKTRQFTSSLNRQRTAGNLSASTTSMNDAD